METKRITITRFPLDSLEKLRQQYAKLIDKEPSEVSESDAVAWGAKQHANVAESAECPMPG